MSMITVKSAKSGEQNSEPPYVDTDMATSRKPSNLPYYFAMAMTALLGYFKTASPGASQEEQDRTERDLTPENSAPRKLDALSDYREPRPGNEEVEATEPALDAPISPVTGGNIINFPYRTTLLESPIEFQESSLNIPVIDTEIEMPLLPTGRPNAPAFKASEASIGMPLPDKKKNRAPEQNASVRLNDVMAGQAVLIGLAELLAQTTDAEGNELVIINVRVSNGSVALTDDGIAFSSNRQNQEGPIVIHYDVSDGSNVVQHTAYFQLSGRTPVLGTPESEILSGIELSDTIIADAGNDLIDARGGDDFISGGAGSDVIMGGSGNDVIRAGAGDDTVFGGIGDDLISGETGNDHLFGNEGKDTITGNEGDDLVDGGNDDDHLAGNDGNDKMSGGSGNDVLLAGSGDDHLNDGLGEDILQGEEGNDVFTLANDLTADRIDGGAGTDTLDLSAASKSIDANLTSNTVLSTETGPDTIRSIEIINTGSGDDTVTGSAADEAMHTGAGNDWISGNEGNDTISAGDGNDVLSDGYGNDILDGGNGNDRLLLESDGADDLINGGAGTDLIDMTGAAVDILVDMVSVTISSEEYGIDTVLNMESVLTGSGNDMFFDSSAVLEFEAGAGDDTIFVALDTSADSFSGGAGSDTLDLSATVSDVTVDLIIGVAAGEEIGINSISGFENVIGGSGDDTVIVDADSLTESLAIVGGGGNDLFEFSFLTTNQAQTANLVHQILDFMVGDQLTIADYHFKRVNEPNGGSRIENVYATDEDGDFVVRLRDVHTGEMHYAVVEVDRDKDDVFEFSVELFEGSDNDAPALPSLV